MSVSAIRYSYLTSLAAILVVLAACGTSDGPVTPPAPPAPTVASVAVGPTSLTLAVGATGQLMATVTLSNGSVSTTPTVTWSSSNPTVASVGPSGTSTTVTAVAPGSATITATSGGQAATVSVAVRPPAQVLTVSLIGPGSGTVTSNPVGINCTTGTCTGSFPSGTAVTLVATAAAGSALDTWGGACSGTGPCSVTVAAATTVTATFRQLPAPVASVAISPSVLNVDEGASGLLTVILRDAAGNTLTGRSVSWVSSDTMVAVVNGSGIVTGRAEGDTVQVRVTSEGVTGTAKVFVRSLFFLARDVSAGGGHTCAIRVNGVTYCWGANDQWRLGSSNAQEDGVRNIVSGGHSFTQLSASNLHTCALDTVGRAWCWGEGFDAQLGDSTRTSSALPRSVKGGHLFASIVTGQGKSCGLTSTGTAYCWGSSGSNLGVGVNGTIFMPTPVVGGFRFAAITIGWSHTCGIDTANLGLCWGDVINFNSILGDGTRESRGAPTALAGALRLRTIATGPGHACGIDMQGLAWCWGYNNWGQGGNGTPVSIPIYVPTRVASNVVFTSIGMGEQHTCAVSVAGEAWCWGRGDNGRLGDGSAQWSAVPVRVAQGAARFSKISVGAAHACALAIDRRVYCWGEGYRGRLGTTGGDARTPLAVSRP